LVETVVKCKRGHLSPRDSHGSCLACKPLTDAAYQLRNRSRILKYQRRYRRTHKSELAAYFERYHLKNRARRRRTMSSYYQAHRSQARARMKTWHKAHPESKRADCHNRRARLKKAPGRHTRHDVLALKLKQRNRCANCNRSLKPGYHVDHIIPITKGGSNWPSNLQLLCPRCNLRKGNRIIQNRGGLGVWMKL
jgi:5-methylcytosine-specific restriction endonuclease McrA